jgi:uncharacterized iron-regulated membrane protein
VTTPVRLAPGESPRPVDPVKVARDINRGGMWELARIGHPWPAVAQGVLLVLLVVFAFTGMPWPSIAFSAVLVGVAVWSQRNVVHWAEAHNAKVAPARSQKPGSDGARATQGPKSTSQAGARSAKSSKAKRRS